MKFNKITSLLAAFVAVSALVAIFLPRESFEPAELAEQVGDSQLTASAPLPPDSSPPRMVLTEQEQALLAELQRFRPGDREHLKKVFNPPTREELDDSVDSADYVDHFSLATNKYDQIWAGFVNGLGLSRADAQLVRDIWIESEARFMELGVALGDGSHEASAAADSQQEVVNRLHSRLSRILTPEQMAAFHDYEEQLVLDVVSFSEEYRNELVGDGYSGLIAASDDDDLATVQAYLAIGADPDRLAADGRSAIHEAAQGNNVEILRALVAAGADVNLPGANGGTALVMAAIFGNADAVRVLVNAGADLAPESPHGPVLGIAARNGDSDVVRILLEAGADASGVVGEEALENAIGFGDREMEQMLIEAGANANAPGVERKRRVMALGRKLGLVDE